MPIQTPTFPADAAATPPAGGVLKLRGWLDFLNSAVWLVKESYRLARWCRAVKVGYCAIDLNCYLAHDGVHPGDILRRNRYPLTFWVVPFHLNTFCWQLRSLKLHHVDFNGGRAAVAEGATKGLGHGAEQTTAARKNQSQPA